MRKETRCSAPKLYFRFLSMHLRTAMEYKTSFLMTFFGQTLTSLSSLLAIYVLFDRFHVVEGYTFSEVLLCNASIYMGFSLTEIFFRGFDTFSREVSSGSFDRLLLRPQSTFFSVSVLRMEFARGGRLLQSIIVMICAIWKADIVWTGMRMLAYALMLLGCTIFFSSLIIIYAGLCFFTIEGLEVMNIFTHGGKELGSYPLDIYGSRALLLFFTFLCPLACAQYYPFLYLTGRTDAVLYALSPLFCIVLLLFSLGFWNYGVRHYQSTGS